MYIYVLMYIYEHAIQALNSSFCVMGRSKGSYYTPSHQAPRVVLESQIHQASPARRRQQNQKRQV